MPAVAKANFRLGGMDVHVDVVRRDGELQIERWANACGNRRPVRGLGGANDSTVAHGSAIDREVHATARRPDLRGSLHQTGDVDRGGNVIDVDESRGGRGAMQGGDGLARRGRGGPRENLLAV